MATTAHLNFAALARISDVGLRARIMVHSYFAGMHPSPRYGRNAEFASYAAYRPGDDLRDIDWRAWARSDEYFIKRYDADCTLNSYLVLDTSGSMCHAGEHTIKMCMSVTVCAALALLMLRQHDAFGLLTFADDIVGDVPPRAHERQFTRVLAALANAPTGGVSRFAPLGPALEQRLKRKSLIVLISDLTGDCAEIGELFERVRFYGHELLCLRPLAVEEVQFPYHGRVILVDAETGERQMVQAREVRAAYQENLRAHGEQLLRCAARHAVDIETFTAHDVSIKPLAAYLVKRKMAP